MRSVVSGSIQEVFRGGERMSNFDVSVMFR